MGTGADSTGGQRVVETLKRRFAQMRLEARPTPGERSLLVTLPLRGEPFPSPDRPLRMRSLLFATVGATRIKCLAPPPLFYLPLVDIGRCTSPDAIEQRIRDAWRERQDQLARARGWLEKLGCAPEPLRDAPVLKLDLEGLGDPVELTVSEPGRVILPGAGPLSGVPLERAEDRSFRPDAELDSAVDLELAVSARIEALAGLRARIERDERIAAVSQAPPCFLVEGPSRQHRLLLVGPRLAVDQRLIELLRLRGYQVWAARSSTEGMRAFDSRSFELVLADTDLGRYEGVELIASLRQLPGIEELPVVLVDDRCRTQRREAARRFGAAGYLVHPIDVAKIEEGLGRMVTAPRRRRYTRYTQRLPVRIVGESRSEVTNQVGRGGMFLNTPRDVPTQAVERYEIALPELNAALRVEAEVVYLSRSTQPGRTGIGLRFHEFPDRDEELLIEFLRRLEPPPDPN